MQDLARRLATAPRRAWPGRPVPVSLVITGLDVGGAERALVALATGLDRRRWAPSVVALDGEGALAGPLRASGIGVACLSVDRRKPWQAVARLAKALRDSNPELIQSFLFHANVAARLAAPLAGRPWVLGGLRVAERQRRWHLALDRLTGRMAAGSVCVSEGVRRFSREAGGLDPDRLVVIPNGVDPGPHDRAGAVDRAPLGVPADAILALYVGRLDPQKGLPRLLEAAARVARARPDWHLALAGDGPDRDALHEQARNLPDLDGRVHWLGRRDDVPGLLRSADLLVLPSLWEGMPNAVLEAMAAGRAVVATAVEGSEELVRPGRTGWLVPSGEAGPLAEALLDAASDRDRLARYGRAGRARIEAEFDPGRVVAAYERLWAGVLGYDPDAGPA
ncbi:glycosyltransferase [Tundrisphaera sp. TA3]|uniref:glycosyltransferase n=1 Tax=Tundrisphaera sp. TA3 TaxID=3435775 RepID=UPI003EC11FA2